MGFNTVERRRAGLPWGLLGMVGLVVAVESAMATKEVHFTRALEADWKQSGLAARRQAPGCDILCFGSSMVKYGVLPPILEGRLGKSAYNLALFGGSPPSSYFLLRRAVASGARPSAVVVDFQPASLRIPPVRGLDISHWSELLEPRDCAELALDSCDGRFFLATMAGRYLPTVRLRFQIRCMIVAAIARRRASQSRFTLMTRRNWHRNRGAIAQPKDPGYRGEAPADPHLFHRWGCDPVNVTYTRKFLELAARHDIPVFWLIPPYAPASQERLERLGIDPPYDRFLHACQSRYPSLVVIDGRHAGYTHTVFWDYVHLDCEGGSILSDDVATILRPYLTGVSAGPSWVALPAFRPRRIDIEVEDLIQSMAVVRRSFERPRR